MVKNEAIETAIEDLKSQKKSNYVITARSFNVDQNMLAQHFKNQSISISEAYFRNQKLFSNTQTIVFVEHIKELTNLNIPPNFQIIKNLVVEIIKPLVNKC